MPRLVVGSSFSARARQGAAMRGLRPSGGLAEPHGDGVVLPKPSGEDSFAEESQEAGTVEASEAVHTKTPCFQDVFDVAETDEPLGLSNMPRMMPRFPLQRSSHVETLLEKHHQEVVRNLGRMMAQQESVLRELLEQYLLPVWCSQGIAGAPPVDGTSSSPRATTPLASPLPGSSPRPSTLQSSLAQMRRGFSSPALRRGPSTSSDMRSARGWNSETKCVDHGASVKKSLGRSMTKYVDVSERNKSERQRAIRRSMEEQMYNEEQKRSADELEFQERPTSYRSQLSLRGCCRRLVESVYFELTFAVMIVSNSLFIGAEVGYFAQNPSSPTPIIFYVSQFLYAAIFFVELLMRIVGFGCHRFWCDSNQWLWNWFDSFVVFSSLVDIAFWILIMSEIADTGNSSTGSFSILRMARMARLFRVLRIGRLMRFVKSLRLLVLSILSSLRALFWAMVLLLIIIYVYGILLAQAIADHFAELEVRGEDTDGEFHDNLRRYWGSLQTAMFTLFESIAGGLSWNEAVIPLKTLSIFWVVVFTSFITFAYFAVLNVMTGVFCQTAFENMQKQQDLLFQDMLSNKTYHVENINKLFEKMDDDRSGELCFTELHQCWNDESMQKFFAALDLNPDDCWMMFKLLDTDESHSVTAQEFVEGCMRLRGQAKAFDMAVMHHEQRLQAKQITEFMNRMEEGVSAILSGHVPRITGGNKRSTESASLRMSLETAADEFQDGTGTPPHGHGKAGTNAESAWRASIR